MRIEFLGDIANVRTGKYDANHGTLDGKYKFYTCAYGQFKAPTFSFEGEAIVLPGNGANVGEVFFNEGEKFEAYQRTYVVENIRENPKYVYMYFKTFWKHSLKNTQYGSATNYIRLDNLTKFKIPLPPIQEQTLIAEILTQAENLITQRKESILLLDELLKSTFLEMFGDPVSNKKNWDTASLDSTCNFENGDRSSNYPSGDDIINDGVIFINSSNIVDFRFIPSNPNFISLKKFNSLRSGKCNKGDILFTLRGNGLGKCCVFESKYKIGFVNAQIVIIRPNDAINNFFLIEQFRTTSMFKNIWKLGSGSAQPQLAVSQLKKLKIISPPIELQNRYGLIVEKVELLKKEYEASLEELENMYGVLSQKAFKGELKL